MMTLRHLKGRKSFWCCESGVAGLEFAFIGPVLILLLFGCVTLFHGFEGSVVVEKATFTVGDMMSRQTTVTNSSLKTMKTLFSKMIPNSTSLVTFRISSVKKLNGLLKVDWSYAEAPTPKLVTADIPLSQMPLIQEGDSVILVETSVGFTPLLASVGLSAGTYDQIAANRPRFTSSVVKTDGN